MSLTIGVPRETYAGEKRVAAVPEVFEKLIKLGFAVRVESGAGAAANFSDESYQAAGAQIAASAAELMGGSDILFKVRAPTPDEIALMRPGSTLISFIAQEVAARYGLGQLPKMESVAFAYMWSADQDTGPGVGAWHPHMMVYAPYYENSTLGGNELGGPAPFVAGGGTPYSIALITVDGKLAISAREK